MAEGIFKSLVSKPPYQSLKIEADSCGTGAYHTGSSPDSRTMSTLEDYGITDYDHAARKVCLNYFSNANDVANSSPDPHLRLSEV